MTTWPVVALGVVVGAGGGGAARHTARGYRPAAPVPVDLPADRSSSPGPARGVFELVGAGACGGLAVVHPVPEVLAGWWLVLVGLALGYVDVTTYRLPTPLCLAAYLGVTASLGLGAVAGHDPAPLLRALLGGLLLAAAFLALALASPAGMGVGDAKLAASLGTVLAWTSWSTLLTGTVLAFGLAAVPATITLLRHPVGHRREIAFGPYLLAGTLVALLTA